jgi:predicted nucleic acid-binding protein
MGLVVDASIAAKWVLRDEASASANALLLTVIREGALVPGIFPFEIENILAVAERRRRLEAADVAAALALLKNLRFTVDPFVPAQMGCHLDLARRFGLSTYDAAYVSLAAREGATLFTADAQLEAAARALGIATVCAP